MVEKLRTAYNTILYTALRALFFSSRTVSFFKDANGWTLTMRRGRRVYKYWNIFFLAHPANSFPRFLRFHEELARKGSPHVPQFSVGKWSVSYEYIENARTFMEAMLAAKESRERIELLHRAFDAVRQWHEAGAIHGDLKPKNLLVDPSGEVYLIDLENSFFSSNAKDRMSDYKKFLPRILYLCSSGEVRQAAKGGASELHEALTPYLSAFDCRSAVAEVPGIMFETAHEKTGEDIDITIGSFEDIGRIRQRVNALGVDQRVFAHAVNDIKLIVFNLEMLQIIDVHLKRPLSRSAFRMLRKKNGPWQISLTGPDGAGKTTLLESFSKESADERIVRLKRTVLHASRFGNSIHILGALGLIERVLNRLSFGLFTRLVAYTKIVRTTTDQILLLDRSFYDPLIRREGSLSWSLGQIWRLFIPRSVEHILIVADPHTVASRKPELTPASVAKYYVRAARVLPRALTIDGNERAAAAYQFSSACAYLLFTEARFRA